MKTIFIQALATNTILLGLILIALAFTDAWTWRTL